MHITSSSESTSKKYGAAQTGVVRYVNQANRYRIMLIDRASMASSDWSFTVIGIGW